MVKRSVAGHPHDPGREGDLTRLVLVDRLHQLGEDVLGDVLGLVMVLDQAGDEALYVVRVADVEEVKPLGVAGLSVLDCLLDQTAVAANLSWYQGRT